MDNSIEKKELYRQIVEYSFETTVIHSNQEVLYINDAGVDFFGAEKKEDLLGANVVGIFTEEYREFIVERIRRGEVDKKVGELVETKVHTLDGTVIEVELFCHPVMFGETEAMQSIIRDITPRKEAERRIVEVMTPVVPLSKRVAIIPLVGHLDQDRAIQILECLPSKIQSKGFKNIILDVSGIYNIDEVVLDFLYKLNSTLLLMGVYPIITGIRSELAYKTVNIDGSRGEITSFITKRNVEQALSYLNVT